MDLKVLLTKNQQTLEKQSRSFAWPILQLDPEYLIPIMVQYNLDKTIDTIEDAEALPVATRVKYISQFCKALDNNQVDAALCQAMLATINEDESYVFKNCAETLLLLQQLPAPQQVLAKQWVNIMAKGMQHYLQHPIVTKQDLDDYCYYVAGSVGVYLTELLKLVNPSQTHIDFDSLANKAKGFGLFLQKLNIIRDLSEDKNQKGITRWPSDYLKQHSALEALNRLCFEALTENAKIAIDYYKSLPLLNQSFDHFIRFILWSGLEYLKLLTNNKQVFLKTKVKLAKSMMQYLFNQSKTLSRDAFIEKCETLWKTQWHHFNTMKSMPAA